MSRKGFYQLDNDFIRRYGRDLGASGIAVWNVLQMYADPEGICWPKHGGIAEMIGTSPRTVMRRLLQMEEMGLLAVEAQWDGGRHANRYRLLYGRTDVTNDDSDVTDCQVDTPSDVTKSDTDVTNVGGRCDTVSGPNNVVVNKTHVTRPNYKDPKTCSPAAPDERVPVPPSDKTKPTRKFICPSHWKTGDPLPPYVESKTAPWWPGFCAFYQAYPRLVGPPDAWRAWVKIKRTDPSAELEGEIVSGLSWWVKTGWHDTPRDKIPHPATWLNACRWQAAQEVRPSTNGTPRAKPPVPEEDPEARRRRMDEERRAAAADYQRAMAKIASHPRLRRLARMDGAEVGR